MAKYVTDRRLWLTADRERVVEEGDPEAATLLASKGKELDEATVKRYGLAPPQDKAVRGQANKAAGKAAKGEGA
jgi:hypothetical protein